MYTLFCKAKSAKVKASAYTPSDQINLGSWSFQPLGLCQTICIYFFFLVLICTFTHVSIHLGSFWENTGTMLCCEATARSTFHQHWSWVDHEWIFNFGKTFPLSPLGAGNQLTGRVIVGEMGTSWRCKEAPGPTWLDTWPGLKPTQAVKEGRGTLRPLVLGQKGINTCRG